MKLFQWNDRFSVGVELVDQQHKKLFSIINDLIVAKENQLQGQVIEMILAEIISYTEYHFCSEEKLFKIHPAYERHCLLHKDFVAKMLELAATYHHNAKDISDEILEILIEWLKDHVLHTDMTFFRNLGCQGNEEADDFVQLLEEKQSREKVLVVEDSLVQRRLLREILEQGGHEVFEAENGIEALKVCASITDLRFMITDLDMPYMDGYELIQNIRQNQIQYVYIIVVTAMDKHDTVVKSLSKGANDFLTKPVRPEELNLRLQGGMQLLRLESQNELIFSMAKLADYRSEETGLHLDRVRAYILVLGLYLVEHYPEMGLTVSLASEISKVSPLHDIGKVGIADSILKKPGPLTDEEFEKMKDHSLIGGDLISDIYVKTKSLSMRLAFEIAMYHHECWNGQGYPAGLSGNGIPVAARITALADVYDALTTERVYKKAFDHERAKSIIVEKKGTHFDPRVVNAFLAMETKFVKLKDELHDN